MSRAFDLDDALRHEEALRRLAWLLHLNAADADDAVQHAMTQAALGKRPAGMPMLTFLRTALRHHAFNLRKLAQRRRARELAAAPDGAVMPVDEMIARDQLRRQVADAVLALDEPYRTTVWLRWFEVGSVEAVAARMQVPVNTVRTRLQRAHAKLRERLGCDHRNQQWGLLAAPLGMLATSAATAVAVARTGQLAVKGVLGLIAAGLVVAVSMAFVDGELTPPPVAASAPLATALVPPPAAPPKPTPTAREPVRIAAREAGMTVQLADGKPAAAMPVWFWTADDRPTWTERARLRSSLPPGFDDTYMQPEPEPTPLRTDAVGWIPMPASNPVAITVELGPKLWFSAELPHDGALVLPPTCEVVVRVKGAPRDSEWDANFDCATNRRWDYDTRSGRGVVRSEPVKVHGGAGETLHCTVVPGREWTVSGLGYGFEFEDRDVRKRAPFDLTLRVLRRLPRVIVTVRERDGGVTRRDGVVRLQRSSGSIACRHLVEGRAVFDVQEYGLDPTLRVRMADGEEVERTTAFEPTSWTRPATLRLGEQLGDGRQPLRVRLPGVAAGMLHRVFIETPRDGWKDVPAFNQFGPEHELDYGVLDGHVWIAGLEPGQWRQLCFVTTIGRVAMVDAQSNEWIDANWLPSLPAADCNVAALYRRCGNRPKLSASIQLGLPTQHGTPEWRGLWSHAQGPDQDGVTRPPVWKGLTMPATMPWRLRVLDASGEVLLDQSQLR